MRHPLYFPQYRRYGRKEKTVVGEADLQGTQLSIFRGKQLTMFDCVLFVPKKSESEVKTAAFINRKM